MADRPDSEVLDQAQQLAEMLADVGFDHRLENHLGDGTPCAAADLFAARSGDLLALVQAIRMLSPYWRDGEPLINTLKRCPPDVAARALELLRGYGWLAE